MGQRLVIGVIQSPFPGSHLSWDYHSERGQVALPSYHRWLLVGMWVAAQEPTNMFRVTQTVHELPAAFLLWLLEAY